MFSRNNNQCQFVNKKEKKATPLHIDTDPLGISFYEDDLKKGSAHAVVSPVSTHQQDQSSMHSHHAISTSLSPFPSPSSSTSSVTTQLHESKSLPSRADVSRNKCQINRPAQSLQSPPKLSAKSWENIKSPAASFLASFALSPVATERTVEVEREGDEIDDYVLDSIIGYGGFATVRKGFRASDGQKVAIKIIKKQYQTEEPDYRLERELSIWKVLDHPHIVCLQKVLETDTATFLICDYCPGGNLLDLLKKPMSENEARRIFLQLCQAVKYLHEQVKVCHKDLKLENILFDEDNNVKVCDFGLAIYQQPVKINPATNLPLSPEIINELECAAGSLAYAAPEQIRSAKAISCPSTDIWSLGIILYTLVTAQLPFHDDYDLRLQQKILNGQYNIPSNLSEELQQLIRKCLDSNPDSRFNINQVIQSSWCKF
ncbi:hypothetical protein INT48_008186 [Thamnidium elegans]|uniref:Protein kinase domain-containing protein n=1 Tax=Thamnidium elegans TaxID=101142 RepID=A0A8H7W0X3_9FUNG|nr:hypothetical protein INT48_008186 [Thamnidium elegans]